MTTPPPPQVCPDGHVPQLGVRPPTAVGDHAALRGGLRTRAWRARTATVAAARERRAAAAAGLGCRAAAAIDHAAAAIADRATRRVLGRARHQAAGAAVVGRMSINDRADVQVIAQSSGTESSASILGRTRSGSPRIPTRAHQEPGASCVHYLALAASSRLVHKAAAITTVSPPHQRVAATIGDTATNQDGRIVPAITVSDALVPFCLCASVQISVALPYALVADPWGDRRRACWRAGQRGRARRSLRSRSPS